MHLYLYLFSRVNREEWPPYTVHKLYILVVHTMFIVVYTTICLGVDCKEIIFLYSIYIYKFHIFPTTSRSHYT